MKGNGSKISHDAIRKLIAIGEKQGTISLKDLALEMGLSSADTEVFLRQIFPGGMGAHVYKEGNECMVDIDANAIEYMLPLTPSEWMALNHLMTQVTPIQILKNPGLHTLKKKMTDNRPINAVMELLNQLDQWDVQVSEKQQPLLINLEKAAEKKSMVNLETVSGKNYSIYPCKIIHLEGKLSMIAEDSNDHCLVVIAINEVLNIILIESESQGIISNFEVEEFIAAIRSMSEKETRLILKIHDPQSVNLFPDHHFLGKPCMITNPNGDLIWAAYVEPCDALFDWLLVLGTKVEILDPGKFKDEFLMYCEEKLRKVA